MSYTATRSIKGSDSGVSAGYSAGRTVGATRCHPLSNGKNGVPGAFECAHRYVVLQTRVAPSVTFCVTDYEEAQNLIRPPHFAGVG